MVSGSICVCSPAFVSVLLGEAASSQEGLAPCSEPPTFPLSHCVWQPYLLNLKLLKFKFNGDWHDSFPSASPRCPSLWCTWAFPLHCVSCAVHIDLGCITAKCVPVLSGFSRPCLLGREARSWCMTQWSTPSAARTWKRKIKWLVWGSLGQGLWWTIELG